MGIMHFLRLSSWLWRASVELSQVYPDISASSEAHYSVEHNINDSVESQKKTAEKFAKRTALTEKSVY